MEEQEFKSLVLDAEKDPDSGNVRFLQVRHTLLTKLKKGKFPYLIDLVWTNQTSTADGMPSEEEAKQMELLEDSLLKAFRKDTVAHLVFILTGEGERTWSFYAVKPELFGRILNDATADLPLFPLTVQVTRDPDVETYQEVLDLLEP